MSEISFENALYGGGRVFGLHVVEYLAAERGVAAETAADMHVIALDRIAVVGDRHAAGDQTDVADVMLCAGMMAAGEMDIDRPVELVARLAP